MLLKIIKQKYKIKKLNDLRIFKDGIRIVNNMKNKQINKNIIK